MIAIPEPRTTRLAWEQVPDKKIPSLQKFTVGPGERPRKLPWKSIGPDGKPRYYKEKPNQKPVARKRKDPTKKKEVDGLPNQQPSFMTPSEFERRASPPDSSAIMSKDKKIHMIGSSWGFHQDHIALRWNSLPKNLLEELSKDVGSYRIASEPQRKIEKRVETQDAITNWANQGSKKSRLLGYEIRDGEYKAVLAVGGRATHIPADTYRWMMNNGITVHISPQNMVAGGIGVLHAHGHGTPVGTIGLGTDKWSESAKGRTKVLSSAHYDGKDEVVQFQGDVSEGFREEVNRAVGNLLPKYRNMLKFAGVEIVSGKKLMDANPQLAEVKVPSGMNTWNNVGGTYHPGTMRIHTAEYVVRNGKKVPRESPDGVMMHEVGHAIDDIYGMVTGTKIRDDPRFREAYFRDLGRMEKSDKPFFDYFAKKRKGSYERPSQEAVAECFAHINGQGSRSHVEIGDVLNVMFKDAFRGTIAAMRKMLKEDLTNDRVREFFGQ